MPPSLRSSPAPPSHRSLGHFRPTRGAALPGDGSMGCRLSATLTPTASDRPDQSAGANGKPSENISESPGWLRQARPSRPRPAVCCSATSSTGSDCPARARRINSVLLESTVGSTSTVKPGNCGTTASQMASAGQRSGALMPGRSGCGCGVALWRWWRGARATGARPAARSGCAAAAAPSHAWAPAACPGTWQRRTSRGTRL